MGENCTPALRPLGNSSQPNSNQHSFVIPHVVACPHVLPRSATIRFDTSHVTACPYVLPRHATTEFTHFQSSVRSKTPPRVRQGLRHSLAVPVPSSSLEPLTQMSMSCHAIACTVTTVHNHASLSSFNRIRRHFDQYILYIEP